MKTFFLTTILLISTISLAQYKLKCQLVDDSRNSAVLGKLDVATDQYNQVINARMFNTIGANVSVPYLEILLNQTAKLTLKVNDSLSTSTVTLNTASRLQVQDLSLECAVSKK